MTEVSQELRASARKNETVLRNRLAEIGQVKVADKLDVSESTVSRWKDQDIERISLYLAALKLKVVPSDAELFDKDEVWAMRILSIRGLRSVEREKS